MLCWGMASFIGVLQSETVMSSLSLWDIGFGKPSMLTAETPAQHIWWVLGAFSEARNQKCFARKHKCVDYFWNMASAIQLPVLFLGCYCMLLLPPSTGHISGPLLDLPMFTFHCIRFCQMHVLHLGVDLLVAGNVMHVLLFDYVVWGTNGENPNIKLVRAYNDFKTWCKTFKWQSTDIWMVFVCLFCVFFCGGSWKILSSIPHSPIMS